MGQEAPHSELCSHVGPGPEGPLETRYMVDIAHSAVGKVSGGRGEPRYYVGARSLGMSPLSAVGNPVPVRSLAGPGTRS